MRRHFELHIDRPAYQVWDWLANPALLPNWRTGCVDVRPVDELLATDTPSVRIVYQREGRESMAVETQLGARHPESLQLGIDHALFHLLLTYGLRQIDEATVLSVTYDLRIKNLWLRLFWPFIKRDTALELERDHHTLKHRIEDLEEAIVKPVRLN